MAFAVLAIILAMAGSVPTEVSARPQYAALVMDARNGKVLHARNADTRLHPASLTKMMTLYMTFEAVRRGKLKLDQTIRVSARAAGMPASKIGLRKGQRVRIRDMIRAAAVKSANDAAVVLAEAVGGSESNFAKLMTKKARAFGMRKTTFRNASGLTQSGHLSSARDMAVLGRHLFYDYPQYYNLFSRKSVKVHGRTMRLTNRLVGSYRGADGIKTGYTRAAGFNLVASAERGEVRVIASMFGGTSSARRNARVAELLDMGFQRAPKKARVIKPGPKKKIRRKPGAVASAPLPTRRPGSQASLLAQASAAIGKAIVPSAHASAEITNLPITAPDHSPMPKRRPGIAVASNGGQRQEGLWAIQLGAFERREEALAHLTLAMLTDVVEVREADTAIAPTPSTTKKLYRARFTGMKKASADHACQDLTKAGLDCVTVKPGAW